MLKIKYLHSNEINTVSSEKPQINRNSTENISQNMTATLLWTHSKYEAVDTTVLKLKPDF